MAIEGEWKVCKQLTAGKPCTHILRHRQHRKVGGVWYWRVR